MSEQVRDPFPDSDSSRRRSQGLGFTVKAAEVATLATWRATNHLQSTVNNNAGPQNRCEPLRALDPQATWDPSPVTLESSV